MVLLYSLIAGMGITVMRATLMAFIFLLALLSKKQSDHYNTLSIAAFIILIISPEALFDISFQLSFTAVLSIIFIVPKFSDLPETKISFLPLWSRGIARYLYMTILICLAATIGTMPLIMYYFYSMSSVTIIANLIAVPLLGTFTLSLSMFFILCAFFSPALAGFFVKLSSYSTQLSIDIINKLASFPFSSLKTGRPLLHEIILFYALVLLCVKYFEAGRKKIKGADVSSGSLNTYKYLSMIIILFFISDVAYFKLKEHFTSTLKVTVIDVGQGNSIFLQFPGSRNLIIDGGGFPMSSFDTGRTVVAPFLYYNRIRNVDTAVLSHPHPDHLLGLIYILDNFSVRQLWHSGLPVNPQRYPNWDKAIHNNKINVSVLSAGSPEIIINNVRIKVLWPPGFTMENSQMSEEEFNNYSLVLKITYGNTSILVPGDISEAIERKLVMSGIDLKSDVLIVPHHGSVHSSCEKFIKAVNCRYAIVSSGKSNIFKHPHPSVLRRYKDAGVHVYRTDENGAVTVKTDGNNLDIHTFAEKDKPLTF